MSTPNDTAETNSRSVARKLVVWAFRLGQVVSVGAAVVFVLGSIMAEQNVFQFIVIGIVGILLFLFAILLEIAVRVVR